MTLWYVWAFDGIGATAVVGFGVAMYQRYTASRHDKSESPELSAAKASHVIRESPGSLILAGPVLESPVAVGSNINQSFEVHHHYDEGAPSPELILTEPTPDQILREVSSALPFAQENTRRHYIGLSIVWRVFFSAASKLGDSWWVMTKASSTEFVPNLCFRLTSIPADLNAATSGSTLLVKGSILDVQTLYVELNPDPLVRVVKRA